MVDIEPYQYQKATNIKEHNDIVAKINEIVDVINTTNLDTVLPKISALETDISTIKATDSLQWTDIETLKDSQSAQDVTIGTLDAQVEGITESLISNVNIINGTTAGKFKVRLDREQAPSIDSNDYDLQKATSIELIQGSGPSMLKAQITLSDGTSLISDDFLFTTEAIGTDLYISSFVFKNGNVAGTISADIGLSNGTTIEANNFVVPMDPSLINTVQDLSTRLSAVEDGGVSGLDELSAQVQTNTSNIGTLTTEIDDLDIQKADQSNPAQTIKADTTDLRTVKLRDSTDAVGSYLQFNADANKPVRMEYYNGTEVVDSGFVATIDDSGNPKNFTIPSGGEVWEEVNLSNFPTDWVEGDRVKVRLNAYPSTSGANTWTSGVGSVDINTTTNYLSGIIEFSLNTRDTDPIIPLSTKINTAYMSGLTIDTIYSISSWNQKSTLFSIKAFVFNASACKANTIYVTPTSTNIVKMWRLKK